MPGRPSRRRKDWITRVLDISQPIMDSSVEAMTRAATQFHEALGGEALEYLESRGLSEAARGGLLGEVPQDCSPAWHPYRGRLSIPFFNANRDCVLIRFRDLSGTSPAKYLQMADSRNVPYNIPALMSGARTINVCEGELDALTLSSMGLAAIGITGANGWKPHYRKLLDPFERVVIWGDNDDAGRAFNSTVKATMRQAQPAYLENDINDTYVTEGELPILSAFAEAGGLT